LASLNAEPRADHTPGLPQVAQNRLRAVDRHREADRLRLLGDERVDADDVAAAVHERAARVARVDRGVGLDHGLLREARQEAVERKSTRLNSSHLGISYAVFCLKKKKINNKKRQVKNTCSMQ